MKNIMFKPKTLHTTTNTTEKSYRNLACMIMERECIQVILEGGIGNPLADKMTPHSPYNFAYNNPVNYTDPDGFPHFSFSC